MRPVLGLALNAYLCFSLCVILGCESPSVTYVAPAAGGSAGSSGSTGSGGTSGSGGSGAATVGAGGEGGGGGEAGSSAGEPCEPGAASCDGLVPLSCADEGVWVAGSECDAACLGGECVDCTPGDGACDGENAEKVCDDGGSWVSSPCANGCLDGACVEECTDDGAARCRDGNTPEHCDGATFTWVADDDCSGDTPVCDDATGACACAEGMRRCLDADTPEECNAAGVYVPLSDCGGDAPVCGAGVCQCSEGEQQCLDLQHSRECVDGAWVETPCSGDLAACNDVSGACDRPQAMAHVILCAEDINLVCSGTNVCCDRINTNYRECTADADCVQAGGGYTSKFACDNNTDCPPNEICCLFGDPNGSRTTCVTDNGCADGGFQADLVCNPDGDDCPNGTVCQASGSIYPPLYTCQ